MRQPIAVEGPVRTFRGVVPSEVRAARTEFRQRYPDAEMLTPAEAVMWVTGKRAFAEGDEVFVETGRP
jgi:hypothetical protein